MAERGRPSLFTEENVLKALQLATKGKTDLQIAKALGITVTTLHRWKLEHPDFCDALKKAKEVSDDAVERSLRQRALGYSHKAAKFFFDKESLQVITHEYVERYPPDVTACIFWLKNRRPDRWREKQREEDGNDEFRNMTIIQLILKVLPQIPKEMLVEQLQKLEAPK